MNKKTTFVALCLAMSLGSWAQTKQGGISPQMLIEIQKLQSQTPASKALFNAVAANNIDDLEESCQPRS